MIIVDVNLLIYAVNTDAPLHHKAKAWLEETLSGTETVGIAWTVVLAFLRLTTRTGLFQKPLDAETAFRVINAWLEQPVVVIVAPGLNHMGILRDLISMLGSAGNLISDAHLAALAIEQKAELCSTDNDFSRFTGLRWRNPLA